MQFYQSATKGYEEQFLYTNGLSTDGCWCTDVSDDELQVNL